MDARCRWRGLGPLDRALSTAAALGGSEARVADELGSPVGFLIPVPDEPVGDNDDPDDDDDTLAKLADDLGKLEGRTTLVESDVQRLG